MYTAFDLVYHYHGKKSGGPGHNWGPGIKEHYKFLFIHSGKGVFTAEGKTWFLGRGQGFLIYPDSVSQYTADEIDPWTCSWLAFSGSCTESLLAEINLSRDHPVFFAADYSWFETFTDAFDNRYVNSASLAFARQSGLYRFFKELADLATMLERNQSGRPQSQKERYIRQAIGYMHMNFGNRIYVSDIARNVGIDRIYLASLFKETLSMSPQDYLLKYRMEKACELLSDSRLSIADIARSVGYEDPLLFSKMFKRKIGVPPRSFRTIRSIQHDAE